jgi:hypothetical protein
MIFYGNTVTNTKGHGIFIQRRRWWQFWRRRNRLVIRDCIIEANTGHGIWWDG